MNLATTIMAVLLVTYIVIYLGRKIKLPFIVTLIMTGLILDIPRIKVHIMTNLKFLLIRSGAFPVLGSRFLMS